MYKCITYHKEIGSSDIGITCEYCGKQWHWKCEAGCDCLKKAWRKSSDLILGKFLSDLDTYDSDSQQNICCQFTAFLNGEEHTNRDDVLEAISYALDDKDKEQDSVTVNIERNSECIICGKKGSAVLCDSCTKQHKERNMSLQRNYKVFTGTQLFNDFDITEINGRNLEKDGLFCMLFVVSTAQEEDDLQFIDSYSEIYGPFFQLTDAQMWCDNINKVFKELNHELGNKFLVRNDDE